MNQTPEQKLAWAKALKNAYKSALKRKRAELAYTRDFLEKLEDETECPLTHEAIYNFLRCVP
ncbi:MAG: hypothetical protein EOO77_22160 [Oxalobacteraceae bacterium]|nr:MAG: hypothetical protein EOO77_22160 [Oxalobacteraceae bacterium]